MSKIKFSFVIISIIVITSFFSCATNSTLTKKKAPDWVSKNEHEYSKNNLCAVGIARSLDEANSVAISNIGKIINQKIESETTFVNSESLSKTGSAETSSSINQIIKTSALVDSLVGVEIAENWKDKDNNYYSLAILDKTKTYLYYSEKINQNEKEIKEVCNLVSSDEDKFLIYGKLQNAKKLSQDNATYLDIIYAVNKASYTVTAKSVTTVAKIENILNNFSKTVSVKIFDDETNPRIQNFFYDYFSGKGFSVNSQKPDYILDYDINIENTNSDLLFYARYAFNANLKSINSDSVIYSFSTSERIAHKSYEEANQKAIISLEKKLTKAFDEHFIEGVSLK